MIVPTYESSSKEQNLIISKLQQENQELKKRLETVRKKYEFEVKTRDKVYKMLRRKDSQQKEFIEWLESNLEALEMCDRELILTNNKKEIKAYKEVLSKYKEIIGGKHE